MQDTFFWCPHDKANRLARVYRIPNQLGLLEDITVPRPATPSSFESGGGGLISTADDYLKFARLLLGHGEVDGVRFTQPQTIELMTANRLTDVQRRHPFLEVPDFWAGQGFGLGVSMVLEPGAFVCTSACSRGSFGWPGAYGTWWIADPQENMVLIYMIQDLFPLRPDTVALLVNGKRPGGRSAQISFQQMVYAALTH
jgi:CubicO group peptidase (beta-lactamase class C family)